MDFAEWLEGLVAWARQTLAPPSCDCGRGTSLVHEAICSYRVAMTAGYEASDTLDDLGFRDNEAGYEAAALAAAQHRALGLMIGEWIEGDYHCCHAQRRGDDGHTEDCRVGRALPVIAQAAAIQAKYGGDA